IAAAGQRVRTSRLSHVKPTGIWNTHSWAAESYRSIQLDGCSSHPHARLGKYRRHPRLAELQFTPGCLKLACGKCSGSCHAKCCCCVLASAERKSKPRYVE